MSKLYSNLAWNTVKWPKVCKRVTRLQHRIFKAKRKGLTNTVRGLQIKLINSIDAKLLSVYQVTKNTKSLKTAGIDRQIVVKPQIKLKIASQLKLDGKAKPIRQVWIRKQGLCKQPFSNSSGEKRKPLGIPTIRDKAKQQLALLALEPEWEAVFEPNSYGLRKGRSCHDAIETIFLHLRHNRTKYVFDADVRKSFGRIHHSVLLSKLNTFPQMSRQIDAWLKVGIMEGYANRPKLYETLSTQGESQSGSICPLLVNIALHGLESHLKEFCGKKISTKIFNTVTRGPKSRSAACGVIRYAETFVVIHQNKQVVELCIAETKHWLLTLGLEIEKESKLKDARQGFHFLGFQILLVKRGKGINHPYKVKITPAKENCLRFLEKIRTVIQRAKAWSSYDLIRVLRPMIIRWANYYRFSECKRTFSKLDFSIFGMLRAWVFRRDTRNGRLKIKQKYFPSGNTYEFQGKIYNDNWVLVGKIKTKNGVKTNFLPRINWIESGKYVKVKDIQSPFDGDFIYWSLRFSKGLV